MQKNNWSTVFTHKRLVLRCSAEPNRPERRTETVQQQQTAEHGSTAHLRGGWRRDGQTAPPLNSVLKFWKGFKNQMIRFKDIWKK